MTDTHKERQDKEMCTDEAVRRCGYVVLRVSMEYDESEATVLPRHDLCLLLFCRFSYLLFIYFFIYFLFYE